MENIKVSVVCLVYNHEKYIRKCLESLVSQKTDFKYEVLVHDDASTDNSAKIIKEFEENYPNIIKPIYQTENQWSKHIGIFKTFQLPRIKGTYIAFCEGDDYWINENKLQLQYDALENNLDCKICVHDTNCINEDGSYNDKHYPLHSFSSGVIDGKYILLKYPDWIFHLSSFFIRKEIIDKLYYGGLGLVETCPAGDLVIQYFSATCGNYYYIKDDMSVYRLFSKESFTEKLRRGDNFVYIINRFISFTNIFKNYLNDYYSYDLEDVMSDALAEYNIKMLLQKKDYKTIYQYRNFKFFKGFNKKLKLVVMLSKYMPGFEKIYNKRG